MAKPLPLRYTPSALRDLEDYARFIAKDGPERARRWLESFDATLRRLERFPRSGKVPADAALRRGGYRIAVVGDVLAFYTVGSRFVEVRRVVHGRRNYAFLSDAEGR